MIHPQAPILTGIATGVIDRPDQFTPTWTVNEVLMAQRFVEEILHTSTKSGGRWVHSRGCPLGGKAADADGRAGVSPKAEQTSGQRPGRHGAAKTSALIPTSMRRIPGA